MAEDKKGVKNKDLGKSEKDPNERRRLGLFAWLGPMLDRRTPRVEKLEKGDFDEKEQKD